MGAEGRKNGQIPKVESLGYTGGLNMICEGQREVKDDPKVFVLSS
jgi:hypothetical protein